MSHYRGMLNIADAMQMYSANFQYKETPYIVSKEATNLTLPSGVAPCEVVIGDKPVGNLVGSAEQGFLDIYYTLENNVKYYSYSPCFRQEQVYDMLHRPYFNKVELFCKNPVDEYKTLQYLMDKATEVFSLLNDSNTIDIRTKRITDEYYDILINGIEVGSYQIYRKEDKLWVCGTGLAEPRFTYALSVA